MTYDTRQKLMASIRSLRTALKLTQTEFGKLFGKSLPTIQRWETLRPPGGWALIRLLDLAKRHAADPQCDALAKVFRDALASEQKSFKLVGVAVGSSVNQGFVVPAPLAFHIRPRTTDEARAVAAVLDALRNPARTAAVNKVLTEVLKEEYAKFSDKDLEPYASKKGKSK